MYLRRFYFIILVYANLKMEYDTKDKTFWKRKGNDMKVLLGAVNAKYIHSNLAVYCLKAYAEKYGPFSSESEETVYFLPPSDWLYSSLIVFSF